MSREEEILKLIRNNPMISQDEIADSLNIKRSTVGVHILNLTKKGLIVGRGYILNEDGYILGIGSSNVDIYGKSFSPLKEKYDHPSNITTNVGGVTRNILKNLSILDAKTKFITAIGDDLYGKLIIEDCKETGMEISDILRVENCSSGVFMQILDDKNDMHLAMTDFKAISHLEPSYLKGKTKLITGAKAIVCDPAMPVESLKYICTFGRPVFVDPTSEALALKIKDIIGNFALVKPNVKELAILSDMEINDDEDIINACKKLIAKGVKKVCVSHGAKGYVYVDSNGKILKKHLKPVENMANASGAGDAFMALLLYGFLNGLDLELTLDYANAAGCAAITCKDTINPDLSISLIEDILKERK